MILQAGTCDSLILAGALQRESELDAYRNMPRGAFETRVCGFFDGLVKVLS